MSFFGTLVSAGQTHAHNIRLRLIVWCKVQSGFLSSSLHEVSTSFLDLMTFSVKEKWSGKDIGSDFSRGRPEGRVVNDKAIQVHVVTPKTSLLSLRLIWSSGSSPRGEVTPHCTSTYHLEA